MIVDFFANHPMYRRGFSRGFICGLTAGLCILAIAFVLGLAVSGAPPFPPSWR